jgi:hypothetical protein
MVSIGKQQPGPVCVSYSTVRKKRDTCRAEDIITPEGSPQSTPHSTPVELPVIHEPTPVRFAGIVDPSPTHSSPERNSSPTWIHTTPLHTVVDKGHLEISQFLLQQGGDIDAQDYSNCPIGR